MNETILFTFDSMDGAEELVRLVDSDGAAEYTHEFGNEEATTLEYARDYAQRYGESVIVYALVPMFKIVPPEQIDFEVIRLNHTIEEVE